MRVCALLLITAGSVAHGCASASCKNNYDRILMRNIEKDVGKLILKLSFLYNNNSILCSGIQSYKMILAKLS